MERSQERRSEHVSKRIDRECVCVSFSSAFSSPKQLLRLFDSTNISAHSSAELILGCTATARRSGAADGDAGPCPHVTVVAALPCRGTHVSIILILCRSLHQPCRLTCCIVCCVTFPLLVLSPDCLADPSLPPSQFSTSLYYSGYLSIPISTSTRLYRIDLRLLPPLSPKSRPQLSLRVDERLRTFLSGSGAILQQRWQQCADVHAFLLDLKDIVTQLLASPAASLSAGMVRRPASFYRTVSDELRAIGWQNVSAVADDFASITLTHTDSAIPYTHSLHLSLPFNYPAVPPTVKADLPLPLPMPPAAPSLSAIHSVFVVMAASLSAYCAVLNHIDQTLLVLDPSPPTLSIATRRLRVSPSLLCQLTLTPSTPYELPPQLQFLGDKADTLRLAWDAHCQHWQPPTTPAGLLDAIEQAVGVQFNRAASVGAAAVDDGDEVVEGACICCWEWRGEAAGGREPDVRCERCAAVYHGSCLYETLSALPTTQLVYDMCFGKCVNCQHSIAIPVR